MTTIGTLSPTGLGRLNRDDDRVRVSVVDGSWHLDPARDARAEFEAAHIPGAVFFDLEEIADPDTDLPHMLPSPERFAAAAGDLGVSHTNTIAVYDTIGLFSAPRVAWMFRLMGAGDVRILKGGLPAWREAGFPVEGGAPVVEPRLFTPSASLSAAVDIEEMRRIVTDRTAQVVDVRPRGRFCGTDPEPRPGLRPGHMPGAVSLPATHLLGEGGAFAPPKTVRALLEEQGIALDAPIVTTCGSGVAAALAALAFEQAGATDVRVYDGSWAEWGRPEGGPVEATRE